MWLMSAKTEKWLPTVQLDLTRPHRFSDRLKEIDLFFRKKDPVHATMNRLARRLEKAGISHAIMGGMAVNAHRYVRTTGDVDFLLTPEGFAAFKRLFVPRYYERLPGAPRKFRDRKSKVKVGSLVTGLYPGSGKPGPIAFPDPTEVCETIDKHQVVDLLTLVQLKLAARRHRDFADVVELILYNDLDESYGKKLHPSVRSDFIECLEEKRREDEYEARKSPFD
jgi:hypothetical protein